MKPKEKATSFWYIFFCLLAVLGFLFSIIGLSLDCPFNQELDYLGVIVAILAILVTSVLTWSIAKTVEINKYISQHKTLMMELEKMKSDFTTKQLSYDCEKNKALALLYTGLNYPALCCDPINDYYGFSYCITYISQLVSLGRENEVELFLSSFMSLNFKKKDLSISSEQRDDLLSKIGMIDYGKSLYKTMEEFEKYICSIGTKSK